MSSYFRDLYQRFDELSPAAKYVVGAAAVAVPAYFLLCKRRSRKGPVKKDWKEGIVYLYQFPRSRYLPSLSPYCLKVETWLRMADIPYENVEFNFWKIRSREGTLPFVELNGIEHPDSSLLIRDLSRILKPRNDIEMSAEQKGAARAFEQMVDNVTSLTFGYVRYVDFTQDTCSENILGPMPLWFRMYPKFVWVNMIKKRLYHHGIGRHSRQEIVNIGLDDLRAISNYLGTKQYMMGEQPSRVDAAVFGTVSLMVYLPFPTPHKRFIEAECPNLVAYCDRMKLKFYPDWDEMTQTLSLHTKWKFWEPAVH